MKMLNRSLLTMAAAGLLVVAASYAHAYPTAGEIVATWDTSGMLGTEATLLGTGSTNVSAELLLRGPGLAGNSGSNSMNASGWHDLGADDYFQFGITVTQGYATNLNELWVGTRSSNTGPRHLGLYSSQDNYTTALFTFTQTNANYNNITIDLSGLGPVSGSLYLRIYATDTTPASSTYTSIGSTGTFRVTDFYDTAAQNIVLTGDTYQVTSPVPVPAAGWLLASGLAGLAAARRKTR